MMTYALMAHFMMLSTVCRRLYCTCHKLGVMALLSGSLDSQCCDIDCNLLVPDNPVAAPMLYCWPHDQAASLDAASVVGSASVCQ
jgi:hypothetical protein